MTVLTERKRGALHDICRRYHVARLDVFGSAATGNFRRTSDIDFLVEFDCAPDMDAADQYFGLLHDLETLFRRNVHLVSSRALRNPYFIKAVNETRKAVYEAKDSKTSRRHPRRRLVHS